MSIYTTIFSTTFLILFIGFILPTSSANAIPTLSPRNVESLKEFCAKMYATLSYAMFIKLSECVDLLKGKRIQVAQQSKVDYLQFLDNALQKELKQEESRFLITLLKNLKRE